MKKLLLLSGVVAGLAFASSNALAVRGTVTISGTVLNQSEDAHSFNVMKSHGVSQKRPAVYSRTGHRRRNYHKQTHKNIL